AVPPLISDIDLSVDDRWLYVSCWGTGELKQYDVADPFAPRETGSVRLGGIVARPGPPAAPQGVLSGGAAGGGGSASAPRQAHPAAPEVLLSGGPQMVEVSRDGRRVYVTNSIYAAWDDIF